MLGRPSHKAEEVAAMGEAGEKHLRQKEQQVQGLSGKQGWECLRSKTEASVPRAE